MAPRVLLFARVNPGDEGGVQTVVRRLARHLKSRGHQVALIWGLKPASASEDLVYELPPLIMRGRLPAPRSALQALGALMHLSRILLRTRPHVVNVHYVTNEAIYFVLLKRVFRYKLVLSVHGSDALRPQAPDAPLLPWVLSRADAVTAVSDGAATRVAELSPSLGSCLRVIRNGIDVDFWADGSPADTAARTTPVVLSVGRLDPVKGQDVLIRALPRVLEAAPAARLVLVGNGGGRAALEQVAEEAGVARAVEFAGPLDAEAVRARMREASCFVLPSRSEGLPLALLEAMAAGVPVVATAVGGSREVVTPESGILVPPEDPDSLAKAIARVLLDPAAAAVYSHEGRARASDFSAARALDEYEALLRQVAKSTSAAHRRKRNAGEAEVAG
jgi:glycosyltransferase involved in cell wall biosynthesis